MFINIISISYFSPKIMSTSIFIFHSLFTKSTFLLDWDSPKLWCYILFDLFYDPLILLWGHNGCSIHLLSSMSLLFSPFSKHYWSIIKFWSRRSSLRITIIPEIILLLRLILILYSLYPIHFNTSNHSQIFISTRSRRYIILWFRATNVLLRAWWWILFR